MRPALVRARLLRAALATFVLAGATVVFQPRPGVAGPLNPVPQDRSVDPVVLPGSAFPQWSGGAEVTVRVPQVAQPTAANPSDCDDEPGNEHDPSPDHSCNQRPTISMYGLQGARPGLAKPVDRILGYRWTGTGFEQIPLQVDERFTRYLSNNSSDFAVYSGVDQHLTYAFDREGFRFTHNPASNACLSTHRSGKAQKDPLTGLDDNDEIAFMYRDAGTALAPPGTPAPTGIQRLYAVTIGDPSNKGGTRYAYVALAQPGGPKRAFDASNGYVRYERDADAEQFVFSESSYEGYGAAPEGPYFDDTTADGNPATFECRTEPIRQRRPRDTAWVTTDTYRFRYEGRWLMTALHIRQPGADGTYGPDVIDRWKARAFQQDPGSETPCCGYEEEDTNWGGSSILLGERTGPVRAIRETWGADSGTNVVRREVFYRDQIQYFSYLRVHVVPPLDGIYTQWDYNAGRMTKYFNPQKPSGVSVDGVGDEVFGNLDDPCNSKYDDAGDQTDEQYRELYRTLQLCNLEYHQSIDLPDPTFGAPNGSLQWEQVSGPEGSLVTRWSVNREHATPGGVAQGVVAVPYYRDDSCFDDGTGTDPGPVLNLRSANEQTTYVDPVLGTQNRRCWQTSDGLPDPSFTPASGLDREGDERFFQGDIGAHGLHLLFVAESDNASLTVPINEINAVQRQVILRGEQPNVGDRYGRWVEFPLTAVAVPHQ